MEPHVLSHKDRIDFIARKIAQDAMSESERRELAHHLIGHGLSILDELDAPAKRPHGAPMDTPTGGLLDHLSKFTSDPGGANA